VGGFRTYGSTTGHRPQQRRVDLNHLLHRLTRDPVPRRRPRIRRHDDAALEAERQRGGAVRDLDGDLRVAVVVGHGAQPLGGGGDGREGEVEGEGWEAVFLDLLGVIVVVGVEGGRRGGVARDERLHGGSWAVCSVGVGEEVERGVGGWS
jgi:hypothetical protein